MSEEKQPMKFYITGGRETEDGTPRNDSLVPALVSYGVDRLDALARSGVTVWTEEEFMNLRRIMPRLPEAQR